MNKEELEDFLCQVTFLTLERGALFVRAGDHAHTVGIVLTGLFRVYYLTEDGQQLVRRFVPEGRIVGDLASQIAGEVAHVSIEALETSEVAVITYLALEQLFDRHPGWQRFGRKLMERYYLLLERREYEFLRYSATERYQQFRSDYPGLEPRISQALVASYLGINPVSLSRIRGSKARQ